MNTYSPLFALFQIVDEIKFIYRHSAKAASLIGKLGWFAVLKIAADLSETIAISRDWIC